MYRYLLNCLLSLIAGTLVIRGSSMTTLSQFSGLDSINSDGDAVIVDGKAYSMVVTGT
jgi:hypothetical protein